jgi:hypothetical protein
LCWLCLELAPKRGILWRKKKKKTVLEETKCDRWILKIRKNTLKGCRKNNNRKGRKKKRVSGRFGVSSIIFHRNCRRINSLSPEDDRDQMYDELKLFFEKDSVCYLRKSQVEFVLHRLHWFHWLQSKILLFNFDRKIFKS